jgi:prolyl oligopeptidase
MQNKFLSLFVLAMPLLFSSQICNSQTKETDDPYLWLEEIESPRSLDWVKAQNAISDQIIGANPLYKNLKDKYLALYNDKDKIAYPTMVGSYVYNLWQDEKHVRGLWRRMSKTDYLNNKNVWETVIDIDALSKKENKKWVFEGANWLQPDNMLCLVSLSDGGKDENEIREFNATTKQFVKNGFFAKESKGDAVWVNKNKVLLNRDFGPGTMTNSGYARQVKIWDRDTPIEKAKLIFETKTENVAAYSNAIFNGTKQYLFVYNLIAFYNSEVFYLNGDKLQKVTYPTDADFVGLHKNEMLFTLQSDWNINDKKYKAGSLVSFDLNENISGKINIRTIWEPNEKSSFEAISTSKDFITVNIMENVQSKLMQYTFQNNAWTGQAVKTPELGSIRLTASESNSNDYFFRYSNFLTPTTLYHGTKTAITVNKKLKAGFDTSNMQIEQFTVASKDGTQIPYFMVHKKDMKFNGDNPAMIEAYGGFNVSFQPNYNATMGAGWLDQGGVYVLANIRGGGEFGPSWHQAAMKEKKQNSYDDVYAVCEELIKKKITSPKHLGAFGWSNGGLLAGVLFTERPDLFNAVVVGAPLLDMKRYSKMLAGASWMGEYGNPDIPEEWDYIQKYSPYQNLSKDKKYPEVYFVTSTKDDRVHPGHARKMAARMTEMGHPYLYHETIEGGHGGASTNEQEADVWSGIYTYFNMKLKSTK